MASTYYLYDDALSIADDILSRTEDRYDLDKKRYFAALTIQRSYRGHSARNGLKRWKRAATLIQKIFRGWLLRWHLPEIAAEAFSLKSDRYYNKMATKIQSTFRGYQVRKIYNVKDITDEKAAMKETNDRILDFFQNLYQKESSQSLSDIFRDLDPTFDKEEQKLLQVNKTTRHLVNSLFHKHHLMRTKQIEGVLSIHKSDELSAIEKLLQNLRGKDYMSEVHQTFYEKPECKEGHIFKSKKLIKIEDFLREKKNHEPKTPTVDINKEVDKDIHKLPFILKPNIEPPSYKPNLFSKEKYTGIQLPVFRKEKKRGYAREVHKTRKVRPEGYHLDYWTKKCCIHNIPE